jgi:methylmalonyl-CoA mutase N-terminal domain/subunit
VTPAVGDERRSSSNFVTAPHYTVSDADPAPPPPGVFPFTRGFRPEGYRRKFWDWEMYAGFGSPEEANRRYRFLLDNGATGGVSVALDLPTQIGYDSDDGMALGEVGRVGVAVDSYADFEQLLEGVDLASVGHVFSTANAIGPIFYAWMLTYCRRHDVDPGSFRLQIQNDPIKEYYARGTHFLPIEAAVRLATDTVVYSHANTPNWLPISVSGSHMKQAGASPALEAAFTIANAIAYLEEVQRKGVEVKSFNPSLELHFCTDMDFFEEVAKYRAVRQAWSEIAAQRFDVPPDRMEFRLHAATSGLPLTAQQPMNNIARITLQALAQILGGCDGTRTASWDEALGIPTEEAAALSLRINQVIAHETGVPDVTDPLGGSYYVEALTRQIRDVIVGEIARIDAMGGALAAVRSGYYSRCLAEGAYEQQQDLESGRRVIVGVNGYRTDDHVVYARFRHDETSEQRQVDRLQRHRAGRDEGPFAATLRDLEDASASDDNVVPAVISAVEAGATIGEISGCWRKVMGEHCDAWTIV